MDSNGSYGDVVDIGTSSLVLNYPFNFRKASLNNLYWIVAVFQIFFLGLLLLTILQGTTHRHPVTFAFFAFSWLASWIALLPYLGRVWDNVKSLSSRYSNIEPSTNSFKICIVNALTLKYLWMVMSGLLSVFSGEILRVLLMSRFGNPRAKIARPQQKRKTVDFLDSKSPGVCLKSIESQPPGMSGALKTLLGRLLSKLNKIRNIHLWEITLVFIPALTSLPAPIITAERLALDDWQSVNVNRFACNAIGRDVEEKLTLLIMWHLVPSSFLSLISLVTYISLCRQAARKASSLFHFGLTLRLGALSILSGFRGVACMVAVSDIGTLTRDRKPILEIYDHVPSISFVLHRFIDLQYCDYSKMQSKPNLLQGDCRFIKTNAHQQ